MVYSTQIAKQMVWVSSLLPYAQCEQVFEWIGERFIPASSIWRQTQKHGARLQSYVEQQREKVSVERIVLPDSRYDHDVRKAGSMDGGMVNIRGKGWRELKVGAVFDVETGLERNPQTQELDEMAHGVTMSTTPPFLAPKRTSRPLYGPWPLSTMCQLPKTVLLLAMGPYGFGTWPKMWSQMDGRLSIGFMPHNI